MASSDSVLPCAVRLAVHELRTPLTVVAGYLRMLLREQGGPLNDKQRKMVEEAERSCARITALVEDLRDLGRLEAGDITMAQQEIDVARLLAELASDMHEGEDRGVRLELRGTDQPVMVTGDRARLAAALKALMHAALRERGEAGAVVAQCSTIDRDGRRFAVITISDDAVIPAPTQYTDDTPMTFDEWREGVGMVLPIARRVIEGHGGAVWSLDHAGRRGAAALRLPLRP